VRERKAIEEDFPFIDDLRIKVREKKAILAPMVGKIIP